MRKAECWFQSKNLHLQYRAWDGTGCEHDALGNGLFSFFPFSGHKGTRPHVKVIS